MFEKLLQCGVVQQHQQTGEGVEYAIDSTAALPQCVECVELAYACR